MENRPDLPPVPAPLKHIKQYLRVASTHDSRDAVVSYWCRLYALQTGLKLSTKTKEETAFLMKLMDWLENTKKELHENECITNDVAAQAYLENWALKAFLIADKNDRAANFGKGLTYIFYMTGLLYDVVAMFGELTEETAQNRKYAKWKATYLHNCMTNGETPIPGPMKNENADDINEYSETVTSNSDSNLPGNEDNAANSDPSGSTDVEISNPLPANLKDGVSLSTDQINKAQKYIKWAGSALNYEDIDTSISCLQKAIHLLETGEDSI